MAKIHLSRKILLSSCLTAWGMLLVSCSSPKTEFFLLQPQHPLQESQTLPAGQAVGIGPVNLASYLERPRLVFEIAPHVMHVSESQRWTGQLDDNICNVLSTEVAYHLNSSSVRTYPWPSDKGLTQQVSIQIQTFHGNAEGDVTLEAEYTIYQLPSRQVKRIKRWSGIEPLEKDGFPSMLQAQSRLLERFAKDIAQSVR